MLRKILIGLAVAVPIALAGLVAFIVIVQTIESAPDDPADVLEWAQANNLLTAEDVEAVMGSGTTVTDGWIGCPEQRLHMYDPVGVSYEFSLADETTERVGECVIFETGEEVYATIDRDVPVDESWERHELALVGADIVEAFAYVEPDDEVAAVVVGTRDLVIFLEEGWTGDTLEETEALTQTAVDKLLD